MKRFNFLTFIILYSSIFQLFSQTDYAKWAIDSLCSPLLHGRGYVNRGDSLAAGFIKNEFIKHNLSQFTLDYFQEFTLPVNTFPGEMSLRLDDKKLKPGQDYLIGAGSSFLQSGRYKTVKYSGADSTVKYILKKRGKTKGRIVAEKKLTHTIATQLNNDLVLHIKESELPANIQCADIKFESKFYKNYTTKNVAAYVKGTQYPDSFIVFSAHYDHLGRLGKDTYFPGANDNASGTAMLLCLAKHFSENPIKYSVVFIAFSAEEAGLLGSNHFVNNPLFSLEKIKFLVNLDILGTGEEGITVVNGSVHKKEFALLQRINNESNYIPKINERGKAANSDHYFFSEKGVPAFFIYTMGGVKAYHDIYDKPETLPLTEFNDVFKLLREFVKHL
jgi:aminopeptidase YwaD